MITIAINEKEIKLEAPVTILEAAKQNGIKIPHFCHHRALEAWGGCRMCLVEVEKMPKLQTACTLFVTDGMVVRTESEAISKARRAVLEFILTNHPLECPVCDKAGECKLQDYTMQYGPTAGRFKEPKIKNPESLADPLIVRNPERCILCTRCVRMCDGVQGASALAIAGRGNHSVMEPFSGGKFECEYCGNCLTVCPVGAIMSKLHRYTFRTWQVTDEVKTVCSFCGVGCTIFLQMRNNEIKRTVPKIGVGANKGLLCNRGRFGYEYVACKERLTTPLIRKNGRLEPATWQEAIETVAARLSGIRDSRGGGAIAGIAGARCTNEENYVFQKLIRGLGSNNIDSIARMGYAPAQRLLEGILGPGVTANAISDIPKSSAVLVMGGDPTEVNPVLGIHIRMAFRRGAKVMTIGHAPGLGRHRTSGVRIKPRTEGILLGGIISALLKEKALPGKDIPLEEKIKGLRLPSAGDVEGATGVSPTTIERLSKELSNAGSAVLAVGRDIACSADRITLTAALAYMLGAKVYLMSERPNEQGLIDMGCLPDRLPGGRAVQAEDARRKCEELWGIKLPSLPGLTLMEIMEGASEGRIRAMYVMGENPAFNLPDSHFAAEALGKLEFLVVQDIFMTETARLAHVVLPASSWGEKDGTYTNLERRLQRLGKAMSGLAMEDWRILSDVGRKTGMRMQYNSPEDIMNEIARISPLHAGLTYKNIEKGVDLWPYLGEMAREDFRLELSPDAFKHPAPQEIYLTVEKPLFHSGTLSRKSPALLSIYPDAVMRLHPETAERFNLKDADTATLSTEKGALPPLKVRLDEGIGPGTVLLSNNFEGKGVMGIMGYSLDPLTRAPMPEGRQVSIKKESR